ncbi:acireductone dioxygenase [Telmatospirillum sp. J64-1]|uniref:1,2-dihydroxy-3-keto-5-methylthiopentene dioxygenase n=1 Tax=Telmatospirillum sp. J64-1 TaxID=2502183 RepID=UPI00115EA247|nr:cupin domain-containing protein [Telmatospirillum sp. J64-1]
MTWLAIYDAANPAAAILESREPALVARYLAEAGLRYERLPLPYDLTAELSVPAILRRMDGFIARQCDLYGYQSADVARVPKGVPNAEILRAKYLEEHTHVEDEARLIIDGAGAFSVHVDDRVFQLVCERGDMISIPAGIPHWFDMGPDPFFAALRFFSNPDGWIASFTGDDIASRFPRFEVN